MEQSVAFLNSPSNFGDPNASVHDAIAAAESIQAAITELNRDLGDMDAAEVHFRRVRAAAEASAKVESFLFAVKGEVLQLPVPASIHPVMGVVMSLL